MLTIHIATIFPEYFDTPFGETIIKRAQEKQLLNIIIHNLRDYTKDKHRNVDDVPFGGGPGMILQVEPVYNLLSKLNAHGTIKSPNSRTILTSPKGVLFDQSLGSSYSKLDQLIIICGRYEGVDHRVSEHLIDEEVSVGNFILSGGEPATITIIDVVVRLIPGVLGNPESLEVESFSKSGDESLETQDLLMEYPQYTRPAIFKTETGEEWGVPEVLREGNHKLIEEWKLKNMKKN